MPTIARLIGGAGTGKTTELMRTLEQVLSRGIDPLQVGFVSFTKAARREASSRAAYQFGGSAEQLEQDGWFRTLHSVCFRTIGEGRATMVTDDAESRKWLAECLQQDVGKPIGADDLDDCDFEAMTDAGRALQLWSAARNRLEPLNKAWERADRCSDKTPDYDECVRLVEQYEQHKRLDGRCDFTDLLGRFAGWTFGIDGHERCAPEGVSPNLPVWFFDEQQDTSALLDDVCHRLIESASWVYVVGDPFQSIYGFAGADASLFRRWAAAKERIMPKSYRCPKPIHEFGEAILREAGDYWDRGIASADHEGSVEIERFTGGLLEQVNPAESWLLLARTNWHANRLSGRIRDLGIPWQPTRGLGGWNRPAKNKALNALFDAAAGLPIDGSDWSTVLNVLPSKDDGTELITRGTKTKWQTDGGKFFKEGRYAVDLGDWGATPELIRRIQSGDWQSLIDSGAEYAAARGQWGYEAVTNSPVRIGTVHSAKGAEADNVLWLTTSTQAVANGCEDPAGFDEECRVGYVAATRARRRLIVAVEPNQRHRFRVPA